VLEEAVQYGQEIGAVYVLEEYAKKRFLHDASMLGIVHLIGNVFKGEAGIVSGLRSIGLNLVDQSGFIKVCISLFLITRRSNS